MHKWLLLVLAAGTGCVAVAQSVRPAEPSRDSSAEATSAQRRSELRNVLSAGRSVEQSASAADAASVGRQLSQQERAEMRELLRRFQPDAPRPHQP